MSVAPKERLLISATGHVKPHFDADKALRGAAVFEGTLTSHSSDLVYEFHINLIEHHTKGNGLFDNFSLVLGEPFTSPVPCRTIEKPSMITYQGDFAGTITLDHWLNIAKLAVTAEAGNRWASVDLHEMEDSHIWNRLYYLSTDLETYVCLLLF